ncbi:MAG TPA: exosortase/archaeosortase family protein [Bryobacteraceae bacterium]|nr:exosortase/archaeosortase family protein [Bryobacteraceae bacterium]
MASVAGGLPGQACPAKSRKAPWAAIAWFALLFAAGGFSILKRLALQWTNDGDMGHGFFVPVVAAYIVWQRRERLSQLSLTPSWWGAAVMLWGAIQGYLGMLGADLFLQRTSVLITLYGLLLLVGGTAIVRALAFPLLLLPFMIPFPGVVYNEITFPLQLFASRVAELSLGVLGVPVYRDGNVLEIPSQRLDVAEACSGIRSLLSLSFLSLVYAYLFDHRVWMRWVLLAATPPVAIVANAGRVTATGLLSEVNPELAHGIFHTMEGWAIFAVSGVMLASLHLFLKRVTRNRSAPA